MRYNCIFIFILSLSQHSLFAADNSGFDDLNKRIEAVEKRLDALQLITSTIEAIDSFSKLVQMQSDKSSLDNKETKSAREEEITEQQSINYFDVEIFEKQIVGSIIEHFEWNTRIIAARPPRPVRAAKGFLVFTDLFDDEQFRMPFTLTETLAQGESIVLPQRMKLYSETRGYLWFEKTDLDDMKAAFDVKEILYLEDAPEKSFTRENLSIQGGIRLLTEAIQNSWVIPNYAKLGMATRIQINMLYSGELVDVSILESSGDELFDESVINAVIKAAPFTEFKNMNLTVFDEYFSNIIIYFQPENL